jgi:hypothetical protein
MKLVIIAVILVLLVLWYFLQPVVKVYGSMSCPWTIKQLNNLPGRYEFFDCAKYQCPSFVKGYPTSEYRGTIYEGYQEKF